MTARAGNLAPVAFRAARPDDAPELARIHLQTWQATYRDVLSAGYLAGLSTGVARRAGALRDAIVSESFAVWVAEREGHLVAWAAFGRSRDADALPTTGELRAINLLPELWSQGIGRQLWQQVHQRLRAAGFTDATVWVIQGHERALRFYQGQGFIQEPDTAMTVVEQDEPLPLVRYRVAL